MEVCPHCGMIVDPMEHIFLWIDMSQIHCPCGYVGLPVDYVKENSPKKRSTDSSKKVEQDKRNLNGVKNGRRNSKIL